MKALVLFVILSIVCSFGQEVQKGEPPTCTASAPVNKGDTATVTCNFNTDLTKLLPVSLSVDFYPHHQNDSVEMMADCNWVRSEEEECQGMKPGVRFRKTGESGIMVLEIHNVTVDYTGQYLCKFMSQNMDPQPSRFCYLFANENVPPKQPDEVNTNDDLIKFTHVQSTEVPETEDQRGRKQAEVTPSLEPGTPDTKSKLNIILPATIVPCVFVICLILFCFARRWRSRARGKLVSDEENNEENDEENNEETIQGSTCGSGETARLSADKAESEMPSGDVREEENVASHTKCPMPLPDKAAQDSDCPMLPTDKAAQAPEEKVECDENSLLVPGTLSNSDSTSVQGGRLRFSINKEEIKMPTAAQAPEEEVERDENSALLVPGTSSDSDSTSVQGGRLRFSIIKEEIKNLAAVKEFNLLEMKKKGVYPFGPKKPAAKW